MNEEKSKQSSFVEHLAELRSRLIKCLIYMFCFFVIKIIINSGKAVIAFGSCNDQNNSQKFWDVIKSYNPDLFIMTGDNVYPKSSGSKLDALEYACIKFPVVNVASSTFIYLEVVIPPPAIRNASLFASC